jgi:TRAP transporter TAXI family solute receptor
LAIRTKSNLERRWPLALGIILLFSGGMQAQSSGALRLATGPTDSTYSVTGAELKRAVESSDANQRVELISTTGSFSNLQLLERRDAEFALVQSDIAGENSRSLAPGQSQPWRLVMVIAQEPVQVVLGSGVREGGLEALSARPLVLGPLNTEGPFTASTILKALGIEYGDVPAQSSTDAAEKLRRGTAQAAFFVSSVPDPEVASLLADPSRRLLSFNTQQMGTLHATSPYYITVTIPERTYPNQIREVSTLAVLTVLLCRADLPNETVKAVTDSLLAAAANSSSERRQELSLSPAEMLQFTDQVGLPLHPGSAQSIKSVPFSFRARAYTHWLQWAFFLFLACLALAVAHLRRPRLLVMRFASPHLPKTVSWILRKLLFHRLLWQVVRTLALFASLWLAGSAVMYLFEREVNINFSNLRVSSLSILVYLFSGLEDRAPVTNGGWIGSVVMLISGLLIAAYITGQFASEITRNTLGVMQMTKNSAKNSILIVGWNARAERVVREIFSAFDVNLPEHNVIVLSDEKVDTQRYSDFESRGVTFISGDAFDKKLLLRIGAHRAHSVIMMANNKSGDPDATTTLAVLALHSLCEDERISEADRPRICAEVMNHRKIELIRDAGADEIVCHEDFGLGVLAQSAFAAKLTEVYQELLSYGTTSCEIYMMSSPSQHEEQDGQIPVDIWQSLFEGKTFPEASEVFNQNRNTENPPILIGLQRGNDVLLNPKTQIQLHDGDSLILIAYVRPSFEHLRPLIAR